MQKLLLAILVSVCSLQISVAHAENLVDLSNWYRIFFHEEKDEDGIKFIENTDTAKFARWYNTLGQEDKNQVLADSVVVCAPTFTEIALQNGGDVKTPVYKVNVAVPLGNKTYVFTTGGRAGVLKSANMFNEYGESALSHALLYLSPKEDEKAEIKQIFKMLIETTPTEGWAPEVSTGAVIYAFSSGEKEVIDLVGAHKFGVSFKTKAAQEALLLTAYRNDEVNHQLLKDLLQNGVDANYQNADGQTALFVAVMKNNVEAVKFLLAHGAKADIVDNAGNNAWQQCENKVYNKDFAERSKCIREFLKTIAEAIEA